MSTKEICTVTRSYTTLASFPELADHQGRSSNPLRLAPNSPLQCMLPSKPGPLTSPFFIQTRKKSSESIHFAHITVGALQPSSKMGLSGAVLSFIGQKTQWSRGYPGDAFLTCRPSIHPSPMKLVHSVLFPNSFPDPLDSIPPVSSVSGAPWLTSHEVYHLQYLRALSLLSWLLS